MAIRQQCPAGTICFSWSMVGVIVILGLILFFIIKPAIDEYHASIVSRQLYLEKRQHPAYNPDPEPPRITIINKGGDDRYTRAPEPIRRPNYGSLPSIATRGDYKPYQQMGYLERKDGTFYPLYGRQTFSSDKFNYYTRTDTYNPVAIPINFKRRDCTDDNGCNELSSGDNVNIAGNEEVKVKLYNSSFMQ